MCNALSSVTYLNVNTTYKHKQNMNVALKAVVLPLLTYICLKMSMISMKLLSLSQFSYIQIYIYSQCVLNDVMYYSYLHTNQSKDECLNLLNTHGHTGTFYILCKPEENTSFLALQMWQCLWFHPNNIPFSNTASFAETEFNWF